jgi:glycogen debranching enzyme
MRRARVAGLEEVLAPDGWALASAPSAGADDPGRFDALFGRDSLITALELLPVRPDVARATLTALAGLQGERDDPATDEEPGKILHELVAPKRFSSLRWTDGGDPRRYYGSADATAWFLVLLASLGDGELAARLERSWRAAGTWLECAIERGGGLVRHAPPRGGGGLLQQGWRDSVDPPDPAYRGAGILREDGTTPAAPLADADTQAVSLVGLRALAALSGEPGPAELARRFARGIEERFGPETMAIEPDGAEVHGAGSQLGWLLWAGALSGQAREAAAARLSRPDILTPFGLRTLSDRHPAYAPHHYHRGAVWPFDSWLGWGGLRAAGRAAEAERVRAGVLEALRRLGDAPELYALGPDGPEPIAIANRVQAWTVGARWALGAGWDGRSPRLFAPA